ncbi:hypothetical protein [Curtobacterium oceanosedimentum]|uniref:hypothetical protein n=1 Tax=Curtobacterium oceanosedimentum TaxID=465820 RepID=UPI003398C314
MLALTLAVIIALAVACALAVAGRPGSPARTVSTWAFGVVAGLALAILIGAHS